MLAIDVSDSMRSKDVPPTRLVAARRAVREFVATSRRSTASASSRSTPARSRSIPPTEDRVALENGLMSRPGPGTAIGDAIVLSVDLARREPAPGGRPPPAAIVVLSDGARRSGACGRPPRRGAPARFASPSTLVVIGTPNGIIERTLVGGFREITRVPSNPAALDQIARTSGGEVFAATDADSLKQVYEELGSQLAPGRRSARSPTTSRPVPRSSCLRARACRPSGSESSSEGRTRRGRLCRDALALGVGEARATNEPGLTVCVPVAGPWVVLPAPTAARRVRGCVPAALRRRRPQRGAQRPRDRRDLPRQPRQPGQPRDHHLDDGALPRALHRRPGAHRDVPSPRRLHPAGGRRRRTRQRSSTSRSTRPGGRPSVACGRIARRRCPPRRAGLRPR